MCIWMHMVILLLVVEGEFGCIGRWRVRLRCVSCFWVRMDGLWGGSRDGWDCVSCLNVSVVVGFWFLSLGYLCCWLRCILFWFKRLLFCVLWSFCEIALHMMGDQAGNVLRIAVRLNCLSRMKRFLLMAKFCSCKDSECLLFRLPMFCLYEARMSYE